jgi:Flp pilus assembly protein TadD
MNNKAILLAQTGLALVFLLSGSGPAAAQPVSVISQPAATAPASSAQSIDAPMPGATPASHAPSAPGSASITQPVPAGAAPAPVASATLPAATKAETAAQPPSTGLAAVQSLTAVQAPGSQNSAAAAPVKGTPAAPANAASQNNSAQNGAVNNSGASNNNGMRVTDILPTPANVRPLPTQYLVVRKDHNANDADARLVAARTALAQGNNQSALEIFDDLYRKNPGDSRVLMGRAVALQKLGQVDGAMDAYEVALRKDPRNIEALTNMLGLLRGKDMPTAVKKLQQLRDLYPANADVTAQLGMVYGVTGDYTNALKYLNMADVLKPGSPTVLYNKAVAYDHMGNTAQAAELYRQLLLLASNGELDQGFPLDVVRQRLATLR